MSRSYRHTAIAGNASAKSEKLDKRLANRKLRAAVREAIHADQEVMPALREVSNPYTFAKDGKHWWLNWVSWRWRNR